MSEIVYVQQYGNNATFKTTWVQTIRWETSELNYFQRRMIELSVVTRKQREKAGKPTATKSYKFTLISPNFLNILKFPKISETYKFLKKYPDICVKGLAWESRNALQCQRLAVFFRAQNFATKQPPIRGNTGSIRGIAGPLRVTSSFFGSNLGSLLKDKINQQRQGFPELHLKPQRKHLLTIRTFNVAMLQLLQFCREKC